MECSLWFLNIFQGKILVRRNGNHRLDRWKGWRGRASWHLALAQTGSLWDFMGVMGWIVYPKKCFFPVPNPSTSTCDIIWIKHCWLNWGRIGGSGGLIQHDFCSCQKRRDNMATWPEKAMWQQAAIRESRNTKDFRPPPEAGRGKDGLSLSDFREHGPADTWILDSSLQNWDDKFLSFYSWRTWLWPPSATSTMEKYFFLR